MKLRQFLGLTLGLLVCCAGSVQAQFGPSGGGGAKPPGLNSSLAKIFGKNTGFSAKVQMIMTDTTGKEVMNAPVDFAFSEGSVSWDMDLALVKSASIPPQAIEQMKQMGMSRIISITKSGGKAFYLVYPGLQSYAEMPLPASEQGTEKSEIKTEKVGEETLNGHKCVKNKVTVMADGKPQELFTWNASDLNDFPVRVEFTDSGSKVTMDYKDVKLTKPDAKLFAPDANFTKYDNVQQMLQGAMMKRFGAPPAK